MLLSHGPSDPVTASAQPDFSLSKDLRRVPPAATLGGMWRSPLTASAPITSRRWGIAGRFSVRRAWEAELEGLGGAGRGRGLGRGGRGPGGAGAGGAGPCAPRVARLPGSPPDPVYCALRVAGFKCSALTRADRGGRPGPAERGGSPRGPRRRGGGLSRLLPGRAALPFFGSCFRTPRSPPYSRAFGAGCCARVRPLGPNMRSRKERLGCAGGCAKVSRQREQRDSDAQQLMGPHRESSSRVSPPIPGSDRGLGHLDLFSFP